MSRNRKSAWAIDFSNFLKPISWHFFNSSDLLIASIFINYRFQTKSCLVPLERPFLGLHFGGKYFEGPTCGHFIFLKIQQNFNTSPMTVANLSFKVAACFWSKFRTLQAGARPCLISSRSPDHRGHFYVKKSKIGLGYRF